jgi:uncharacterized membrane protein
MQTSTTVARHPVHPILVTVPIGLFVAALAFDLAYVGTRQPVWAIVAFWDIVAGIAGGLVAAVPGFLDYLGLRGAARRIATYHMVVNLTVVALFVVNVWTRTAGGQAVIGAGMGIPLGLTIAGVVLMLVGGWLGGEMVYVYRVGVDDRPIPVERVERRRAA